MAADDRRPLLYAIVAVGEKPLAEFALPSAGPSANMSAVARLVLEKIKPQEKEQRAIQYDGYDWNYMYSNGVTFMCLSDGSNRRLPFAYLGNIIDRWNAAFGGSESSAVAYGMNEHFGPVLGEQMRVYSNPSVDRMQRIQEEIAECKDVMATSIDKVLKRGEKIELLVDKTEVLSSQANLFNKKSKQLRKKMWWQNMRLWLLIFFVLFVVIMIILLSVCGTGMCMHRKEDGVGTSKK